MTLSLRLPRIVAALLAGGALAVAGVGFQGLTRNPLAEPSVLGVSSGAAFGVVLAQVFGLRRRLLEALGLTAFAFAGASWRQRRLPHRRAARAGCRSTRCSWPASSSASSSPRRSPCSSRSWTSTGWAASSTGSSATSRPSRRRPAGVFAAAGRARVLARPRPVAPAQPARARRGGRAPARCRRRAGQAPRLRGRGAAHGSGGGFVGPIGFVGLIVPHALRG